MTREELICWNCKQVFVPDHGYEFPNRMIYWHVCPDGIITCNTKKIEKKPNYLSDIEPRSQEEIFNHKLREFYNYGTPERKLFENDFNEQPNLEDFQ